MRTVLASIITTLLIVAMTLAAMFLLVWATVKVTSLPSRWHRAAGMGAELVLGVVLLLGTTWLATHLARRIFRTGEQPPMDLSKLSKRDRKSTRLNSSHRTISYAVFCLKKKTPCQS